MVHTYIKADQRFEKEKYAGLTDNNSVSIYFYIWQPGILIYFWGMCSICVSIIQAYILGKRDLMKTGFVSY